MLNRGSPALFCAAWLTARAAMAQAPAQPWLPSVPEATLPVAGRAPSSVTTVDPLTVTAAALPPEAVKKRTRSFVESFAATTVNLGQITRWSEPLCVVVVGLVPGQAAQVKARVEEVGKAVGRGARQPGCTQNIEIVFTADPQQALDYVAEHREIALGYYHRHQAGVLKTVTRPIQAWYMTATIGKGGSSAGFALQRGGPSAPIQVRGRVVDDPDSEMPAGCGDSHFTACLRSEFENVLVVVDDRRVWDHSLGLISDYVAMLTLSQPRLLDGCNVLPSVMDVFAPACPTHDGPDGLTRADMAYLKALYAADLEAKKAGELSDIAGRMAKTLTPAKAAAR
jgi:hypothetical protein